jgi:hypothetical protein
MDADAAVQPDQDEHHALPPRAIRPQHVQHISVAVVDADELMRAAGADDVHDQPERDQEAERDLSHLPRRHPQTAPAPQLVQRERDVDRKRGVKQERRGDSAPHRGEDPAAGVQGAQRVDAERVVEEMRAGECHQDQAGGQPQLGCDVRTHGHRRGIPSRRRSCTARSPEYRSDTTRWGALERWSTFVQGS